MINVRDYGASGNGTDDDTAAVVSAFGAASKEGVHFPKGDYRLTKKINLANRPITISGDGKSLSRLRWEIADGGIEFTGSGVSANDITTFDIRHIALCTTKPNGGTALRLNWPIMFANPQKKTRISEVEIRGWNAYNPHPSPDYWNRGIWLTNPGGLDISHTDVIGSSKGSDVGILCDSSNNAGAIRHFLSSLYVLCCGIGIDWAGHNEGVYFNNFEIVGSRIGFRATGGGPVYSINNGHFDCHTAGIQLDGLGEAKLSNLALYHTDNGGTKTSGNMISISNCARFTVNACSLYGHPNIGNIVHQNGFFCTASNSGILMGNHFDQIKECGILFGGGTHHCHSIGNRFANCGLHEFLNQGDSSNTHIAL